MSLEGVTEDQPFGDDIITFRIGGNITWIREYYRLVSVRRRLA